jgi:hypothetical protein
MDAALTGMHTIAANTAANTTVSRFIISTLPSRTEKPRDMLAMNRKLEVVDLVIVLPHKMR